MRIVAAGLIGPDLAFVAGVGQRPATTGVMPRRVVPVHNLLHRPALAIAVIAIGAAANLPALATLGAAWLTHIVWDRAVGYTLRPPDGTMRTGVPGRNASSGQRPAER